MDRLERLVNLLAALLQAERPISSEVLRERVPGYPAERASFRRAFERDKDALRAMGIPLVVEAIDPDRPDEVGYRVPRERYELPDPGLTADELAALHLAASTVRIGTSGQQEATGGVDVAATEALWKLGGAIGGAGLATVPVAELPGGEHLPVLFSGLAERRRVAFGYRGAPRKVDPWRIAYGNGRWYLSGFDHGRSDERQFRVDRIEGTPTLVGDPGAFDRPTGLASVPAVPSPWAFGDDEPTLVEVLVDGDQATLAAAQTGEATIVERRSDGSVVLAVQVTNVAALRSWVLGMLDHAEILGPAEVRADMVSWLESMAAPALGSGPPGAHRDRGKR